MSSFPRLKAECPHILDTLDVLWGYKEFYIYLASLTLHSRERPSLGFSAAILQELAEAERAHERCLPRAQHSGAAVAMFATAA
ncbi:MAG: hypothetical protein V4582_15560 [Pseudomonadota bacterium]